MIYCFTKQMLKSLKQSPGFSLTTFYLCLVLMLMLWGSVERWVGWARTNAGCDSRDLDASLHSVTDHRPPPTPITPGTRKLQEAKKEGWKEEALSRLEGQITKCPVVAFCYLCHFGNHDVAGDRADRCLLKKSVVVLMTGVGHQQKIWLDSTKLCRWKS